MSELDVKLHVLAGSATVDLPDTWYPNDSVISNSSQVTKLVSEIKADKHGWRADVLKRIYREGKLDAGSISCHEAICFLTSNNLVKFFPENRDDDADYQITMLGRQVAYEIVDDIHNQSIEKGDLVVLDHIEWDNLPDIYKVQGFVADGSILVVDIDKYNIVVDLECGTNTYQGWLIQYDEIHHATWDEEQVGYRI